MLINLPTSRILESITTITRNRRVKREKVNTERIKFKRKGIIPLHITPQSARRFAKNKRESCEDALKKKKVHYFGLKQSLMRKITLGSNSTSGSNSSDCDALTVISAIFELKVGTNSNLSELQHKLALNHHYNAQHFCHCQEECAIRSKLRKNFESESIFKDMVSPNLLVVKDSCE